MLAAGCDFTWTIANPGELPAETALRARLADLVVMTRPETSHATMLPLAEVLIRLGGAPCLIAPEAWNPARPLEHAVVAWNGGSQAKRAMDDALPLLREAQRVSVLVVGSTSGLEDRLERLTVHLRRKGVKAALEAAPKGDSGAGRALLNWCADQQADLLVMGAFGHTPRVERWFGGATWTVLTGAHLPVLMSC
jgi:nucleotide-binding universal stress UspA family protein